MAGDVELDYDLVGGSVKQLLKLHDVVEQMQRAVGQLRDRQTTDVWPDVQGLEAFSRAYRDAIDLSERDLAVLRQELADASHALSASLRAHDRLDSAEADRMRTLLAALDGTGAAPTAPVTPPAATTENRGSY